MFTYIIALILGSDLLPCYSYNQILLATHKSLLFLSILNICAIKMDSEVNAAFLIHFNVYP